MQNPASDPPIPLELHRKHAAGINTANRESSLPKLPGQPRLAELFATAADPGAIGFALAQIPQDGRLLWVQDRVAQLETGRPCGTGMERFGMNADRLLLACARNAADTLGAMEEGLKCASLAAVIGEIWGDPKALDFTATKRLAFRAERQGIHLFLVRFGGQPDISAARERWRVASRPSLANPDDPDAPGTPRWHVELFRARRRAPGAWEAAYDTAAHRLDLVSPLRDPALEEQARPGDADTILSFPHKGGRVVNG